MIRRRDLQRRARKRYESIRRRQRAKRYLEVLGRFVQQGYLVTNEVIRLHDEPIAVADVLWAGEVEPRFLELLPALLVKQPSMFVDPTALPEDLEKAVHRLRRNLEPAEFRGIPGSVLRRWLPEVGRTKTIPSRSKTFRFKPEDLRLLEALSKELGVTETEVVRRGLRALS